MKQGDVNASKRGIENKGLWGYFILTYAIAALTWGSMIVFRIPGAAVTSTVARQRPIGVLLLFIGGFSPSIAGIFLIWYMGGRAGLRELWKRTILFKFGWKLYLAIFLLPLLVFVIQLGVQLMRGRALTQSGLLTHPSRLIGFTIQILLGGAIAEEFGWRGFVLDQLFKRWNVGVASLILGIFWAFWHLPLFFIPDTIQASRGNVVKEFPVFALLIVSLAVLFSWVYINTNRSLFAVLLFHTVFDWINTFSGTMMNGDIIDRLVHAVTFTVLAAVVLIWWNLNRQPTMVGNEVQKV